MNYLVTKIGSGELHVMAAPQAKLLHNHLKYLQMQGVTKILSLIQSKESSALGLDKEESLAIQEGLKFENFPIIDHGVPETNDLKLLVKRLLKEIKQGEKLVIHCYMGVGRTGVISCAILVENGMSADDAMALVTAKRQLKVPETPEQIEFIKDYALSGL